MPNYEPFLVPVIDILDSNVIFLNLLGQLQNMLIIRLIELVEHIGIKYPIIELLKHRGILGFDLFLINIA